MNCLLKRAALNRETEHKDLLLGCCYLLQHLCMINPTPINPWILKHNLLNVECLLKRNTTWRCVGAVIIASGSLNLNESLWTTYWWVLSCWVCAVGVLCEPWIEISIWQSESSEPSNFGVLRRSMLTPNLIVVERLLSSNSYISLKKRRTAPTLTAKKSKNSFHQLIEYQTCAEVCYRK